MVRRAGRQNHAQRRAARRDDDTAAFAQRVLGTTIWALLGGAALFAFWEFGNFRVLIGDAPLLPPAAHDAPSYFRPARGAEEPASGCTQAPLDRATGQTIPADCHT